MSLTILITSSISIAFFIYVFLRFIFPYVRLRRRFKDFPNKRNPFLLGNILTAPHEPHAWFDFISGALNKNAVQRNQTTRLYNVWVGTWPIVIIYGAEELEGFIDSTVHINKSIDYKVLHPWFAKGLLTSNGVRWKHRRKLLTPAFHFNILRDFLPIFNKQSRICVGLLAKHCESGNPFDVSPFIANVTLDTICETSFGREVHSQTKGSEYTKAVFTLNSIMSKRFRQPWLWVDWIFNLTISGKEQKRCLQIVHKFADKVIQEFQCERKRRKDSAPECDQPPNEPPRRRFFLELMLDLYDLRLQTMEEVQHEVSVFCFEGHDTTNMGLCWFLHWIGNYPTYQDEVFSEIQATFGNDTERDVTVEDFTRIPSLERCIKESLRLSPSVPMIMRSTSEDITIKGLTIPAGTSVMVFIPLVNRDPRYFKNAEVFNPDRFRSEETSSATRHPFSSIPFSAGPRNCIGQKFAFMEMKVLLIWILRRYRVISMQLTDQIRKRADLVLRPEHEVLIRLEPRLSND